MDKSNKWPINFQGTLPSLPLLLFFFCLSVYCFGPTLWKLTSPEWDYDVGSHFSGKQSLKWTWISMATAKLLFLNLCQIRWLDKDDDREVVIVQRAPAFGSSLKLIAFSTLRYLKISDPSHWFDLWGSCQQEQQVSQRWGLVSPSASAWSAVDRVIRTCGKHSLSSWAHHSGLRASTSADMLDLITATGWLDYTRHWLKYLDNFLLGDQQRSTPTFSGHRHPQGRPGLSLWDNLLKVMHV